MSVHQYANNPSTTLSGAVTAGATSITVASGAAFPSQGKFTIIVDSEIMLVTGVSGTTWTVERGSESTAAAAHNNNATVTGILSAGSFLNAHHTDARFHGAKGDGATDDASALQAALTAAGSAGGEVFLPPGTYVVGSTLTIPANVKLRGSGDSTILLFTDTGANAALRPSSGARLENFHLKDTRTPPPAATVGITLSSVNNVVVSGVRIFGFLGAGISASSSTNCVISDCRIDDVGDKSTVTGDGILLSVCEMFRIIGCDITNAGKHGINLAGTDASNTVRDVTVNGCVLNDNGDSGLNAQYTVRAAITGNVADSNGTNGGADGGQGIQIADGCTDVTVVGNVCTNSTEQGIVVQNSCNRITVQGNTASGNAWAGIKVATSCTSVTVSGNTCRENDLQGIEITGSAGANSVVSVVGNTCRSNGQDGIKWTTSTNGTISANVCVDNNTTNNSKSGIVVDGSSSDVAVTGNTCLSSGAPAQEWGIRIYLGDHYTVVGNMARGNTNQISASIETGGGLNFTKTGNLES